MGVQLIELDTDLGSTPGSPIPKMPNELGSVVNRHLSLNSVDDTFNDATYIENSAFGGAGGSNWNGRFTFGLIPASATVLTLKVRALGDPSNNAEVALRVSENIGGAPDIFFLMSSAGYITQSASVPLSYAGISGAYIAVFGDTFGPVAAGVHRVSWIVIEATVPRFPVGETPESIAFSVAETPTAVSFNDCETPV